MHFKPYFYSIIFCPSPYAYLHFQYIHPATIGLHSFCEELVAQQIFDMPHTETWRFVKDSASALHEEEVRHDWSSLDAWLGHWMELSHRFWAFFCCDESECRPSVHFCSGAVKSIILAQLPKQRRDSPPTLLFEEWVADECPWLSNPTISSLSVSRPFFFCVHVRAHRGIPVHLIVVCSCFVLPPDASSSLPRGPLSVCPGPWVTEEFCRGDDSNRKLQLKLPQPAALKETGDWKIVFLCSSVKPVDGNGTVWHILW